MMPNATPYEFGILTSNVHMAWMRTVCGRLKSDYSYSNTIVYNNFPSRSLRPADDAAGTSQSTSDERPRGDAGLRVFDEDERIGLCRGTHENVSKTDGSGRKIRRNKMERVNDE